MPRAPHHPPRPPRQVRLALAAVTLATLTGCATGERPTLIDDPITDVDDEAIISVVERLDRADSAEFTASYTITPSFTGLPTPATVVAAEGRRRILIGDVDYFHDGTVARTCDRDGSDCVDFLDDARVSNLGITHRFWGPAFAARLRLDAGRRVGFSEGSVTTIAGQSAACVDVPVPGLREINSAITYCATNAGVLARYFGADVSIELDEFRLGYDEADLER